MRSSKKAHKEQGEIDGIRHLANADAKEKTERECNPPIPSFDKPGLAAVAALDHFRVAGPLPVGAQVTVERHGNNPHQHAPRW